MEITIRREEEQDYKVVEHLTREAFWNLYKPGCDEHYLVHIMRSHPDFVSELDFVALHENRIVGNIMYTKSHLVSEDNCRMETLTFGPISVLPEFQGKGIGSKLISHTKEIARRDGYSAIIILGDPRNYCKHGFQSSRDYNISNSEGKYPYGQLTLELTPEIFKGRNWKFYYSEIFNIKEEDAENFDKLFEPKIRKIQHSQVEFSIAFRAYLE